MAAMHAWRELPFLDPGLPTSLLPDDWPAAEALRLFVEISARLRAPAWRYAITVMTAEG
jgi:phenylacetic acid degradation operon negative regulatory protein